MSGIKSFRNQSKYELSFIKMEARYNHGTVQPTSSYPTDIWLPWVDTPDQFLTKVLIVEVVREIRYYFWESGEHIYYAESTSELEGPFTLNSQVTIDPRDFSKGRLVPGDSTRSDKIVEFRDTADGRIKFKFERI